MKLTPARVRFVLQLTANEEANGMLTRARRDPADHGTPPSILGPAVLRDGCVVEVRRLTDRDAADLRRFYGKLSERTLFLRFMTPTPRLPDSTLSYLCESGRLDREVLVATWQRTIVAEGRYHRAHGTNDAEIALVVADAWQGRGIGPMLSARLARLARLRGVEAFTGAMLSDNDPARRLLGSAAPGSSQRIRSGELEFRTPLPAV
jgi:GNAT superfamily N-acetyltransferase